MFHLLGSDAAATPSQLSHRQRLKAAGRGGAIQGIFRLLFTGYPAVVRPPRISIREDSYGPVRVKVRVFGAVEATRLRSTL